MESKLSGNVVTYEDPGHASRVVRRRRLLVAGLAFAALAIIAAFVLVQTGYASSSVASMLASVATLVFGANTIAYEWPSATGATPPTGPVMSEHQQMSAIVTGDGAATTFTITHNMNISAADLTAGFPEVPPPEVLLAAGYTAAPVITSKTANTVVFSNTAFTGAGLRVRVIRPRSDMK
jgi:hypothetical protein